MHTSVLYIKVMIILKKERKKERKISEFDSMANCVEYYFLVVILLFLVQLLLIAQFPNNLHAQAQDDDQAGFISLDCGWPDSGYTDKVTGLRYNSDNDFIHSGVSRKIAPKEQSNLTSNQQYFMYVRSFPNGTRNCYTFNSSPIEMKGKPFLIRGSFFYGNYDNINSTNNTSNSQLPMFDLQIGVDAWDTVQISSPSIPIRKEIIHRPNSDFIQVCLISTNTGIPFISALEIRPMNDTVYPIEYANLKTYTRFDFASSSSSSSNQLYRYKEDVYDRIWLPADLEDSTRLTTPIPVMTNINYQVPNVVMNTASVPKNPNDPLVFSWDPDNITDKFYLFLHFAELTYTPPNALREFGIYVNGKPWGYPNYDPITKYSPTYLQTQTFWLLIEDVRSTTNYTLSLNRTMNSTLPPLLNAMELYTIIHASSNSQTNDTSTDAAPANIGKRKKFFIPLVVGIVCFIVLLIILPIIGLVIVKRRNKVLSAVETNPSNPDHDTTNIPDDHDDPRALLKFKTENRQFTYAKVLDITNNLENVLGGGGFGKVYKGCVENTQVAVKILSQSSKQGYKEFQAEVKVLMNVHHKNLTSLVGYCYEGENMALIYEYMSNGSIEMHLSGKISSVIRWHDKLRIAMDAAQGLEYLHNGCSPPIIHRDIKTSNILLDEKFRAKLSDFGLSRVFPTEDDSHVTTEVAGTLGYHDPDVRRVYTKSADVYSFGVVMLEIATGLAPQLKSQEFPHLIDWVKSVVVTGDITNIVDPKVKGDFDPSCMWKYVEVAMACVSGNSMSRPSMTDVVMELKDCLEMEANRDQNNMTIGGLDTTGLLGPSAR